MREQLKNSEIELGLSKTIEEELQESLETLTNLFEEKELQLMETEEDLTLEKERLNELEVEL